MVQNIQPENCTNPLNCVPTRFTCPNKDCNNEIHGRKIAPKVQCNDCEKTLCIKCRSHWHDGTKCGARFEEGLKDLFLNGEQRRCPRCSAVLKKTVIPKPLFRKFDCTRCNYQMCEFCCGTHIERGILPIEEKLFSLVCEYVNNPVIKKIQNRCLLLIIAIQIPYTILLPFATWFYWNFWFTWMIISFNSQREAAAYVS